MINSIVDPVGRNGPDWPKWRHEPLGRNAQRPYYYLTRLNGVVYELDCGSLGKPGWSLYRWEPEGDGWDPTWSHRERTADEPRASAEMAKIMEDLPTYLMEWLL